MQFALETADGVNGRGGFTAPVLENGGLMKSIHLIRIAATGLLLFVASANLPAAGRIEATMEARFDRFSALVESTRGLTFGQRVSTVTDAYDRFFARGVLATLSDEDLRFVFRAARMMSLYSRDDRYQHDLETAFAELKSRGITRRSQVFDLYGMFVATRRFDDAARLLEDNPSIGLEVLPTLEPSPVPEGLPTVLSLKMDSRSMQRMGVVLSTGPRVIVIGHPHCHFSANSVADLEADDGLIRSFREHALWIAPADPTIGYDLIVNWNKLHPDAPVVIAYDAREWPFVDTWETPTFYFLLDGKLKAKVVGWIGPKTREELRRGLAQIGVN